MRRESEDKRDDVDMLGRTREISACAVLGTLRRLARVVLDSAPWLAIYSSVHPTKARKFSR